jgi:hypothetical protein
VQRHHLAEVGRVERARRRATPRAGLEHDEAVDLEDAQRLAQRTAAHPEALEHRALRRQGRARLEVVASDVLHDLPRDGLGYLLGALRHPDNLTDPCGRRLRCLAADEPGRQRS